MIGFGTLTKKAKGFLTQYEQNDPATFAAAQQAIGGILILDGFIGIDNPFEGKKRPGVFGALFGIGMGILFIFIPVFIGNISGSKSMTATTSASIVSVAQEASTSSRGGTTCQLTVRYNVAGKDYTQPSPMSSSGDCSLTIGQTIPINYNPQNPASWAYNLKSTNMFLSIFSWAGVLVAITSFVTFIIRLLSIIFGWKLLKSGRALAKTLPQGTSLASVIEEIKQNFTGVVFNRGGKGMVAVPAMAMAAAQPMQAFVPQPVSPVPAPVPTSVAVPMPTAPVQFAAAPVAVASAPEVVTAPAAQPIAPESPAAQLGFADPDAEPSSTPPTLQPPVQ